MLISGPLCENFDRTLAGRAYYHGLLLREDVPYLLHQNGDFLVRVAQADKMATKLEMVLSVFHDPQGRSSHSKSGKDKENFIVHLVIQSTPKGKFFIDNGKTFNSVDELVHHFTENNVTVRNLNVRLVKGVTLAPWEIQGKHIRIGDLMGGPGPVEVHRCFVKMDGSDREAAGTLISGQSPLAWQALRELARQCRLLRELKHPCVVQFYGVCTLARPCCFLLEYVSEGKLNLYLIKHRGNLKRDELLQMTVSAGWGLDYLHTKGILHRDIAARNCFYNKQLVKLSGFTLARKALVYTMKSLKKLTIRWMAPETVEMFRFSQKSDVYSYGVLIYEIFSQCEPYEGRTSQDVKALIRKGQVNEFPAKTPKTLAEYVKDKMWDRNPSARPNMSTVMVFLTKYTGITLEVAASGECKVHQTASAPASKDVDFVAPPGEEEAQANVMEAVMIGGGKPKAAPAKEPVKASPKSRDKPMKMAKEKVKKEEGPKVAKAEAEVKRKSAEKVTPVEAEPKGKSAEAVASAEGEAKRKSAESVAKPDAEPKVKPGEGVGSAEREPKGKSAESVVKPEAEPKGKPAEGAQEQKKPSPARVEAPQKKPPRDVPRKEPPGVAEQAEGALAGIVNRAGDILFDFGAAMIYAFRAEEGEKKQQSDSAEKRAADPSAPGAAAPSDGSQEKKKP